MTIFSYIKNNTEFLVYYTLKLFFFKTFFKKRALLLVNTGFIGDLLVSSVLLENDQIFEKYSKVKFLIREEYLDLFKNYSGKVEFFGYNYKKYKFSILYKFKFISELRKEGFETCIHLTAARGILNEEIVHLSGAKTKVALNSFLEFLGENIGNYCNNMYSKIIAEDMLNEYDKHFELMNYLNIINSEIIFNRGNTFKELTQQLGSNFTNYNDFIVVAPFTSLMNREWKSEYFKKVIMQLSKKSKIVLLGGLNQKDYLYEMSKGIENTEVLAGDLKLFEIPIFLKKAKLFIGQDSGLTHIAIKMDIPVVSIIGGGEYGRFFPYMESKKTKFLYKKMDCFHCNWVCAFSEKYCLTKVTVERVLLETNKILYEE